MNIKEFYSKLKLMRWIFHCQPDEFPLDWYLSDTEH